ncbi:MAG: hypothetical protein ACRD1L_14545, partial [Terriglobales bacterium]
HPLSAAAAKRERRHLARLERAVDREAGAAPAAAASGRLVNLEGEIWTVDRLAAQFEWSGAAAPDGRIELRFTPAPHRRLATRLERMLSRTAGSLTVDAATGQIEAGGFHSLGPVWFGAGIVAHFASFSGSFSLQPLGDCWVMRRVEAELEGRELFHRIHGTETMLYSEREP